MSAAAQASCNSSRSVNPERTCGSPVTPHFRRNGEFEATALFWANNSAISRDNGGRYCGPEKLFRPSFRTSGRRDQHRDCGPIRGIRNAGAGRGAASSRGWPAALFKRFANIAENFFARRHEDPFRAWPTIGGSFVRRLGQVALAGPFPQRTDVWNQRKERSSPGSRATNRSSDASRSRPKAGRPSAPISPESFASLGLRDFLAQLEQHLRNIDLDRTDLGACAAQAGCERQPGIAGDAVKLRRDDGADRARVNPRIIVAADLAIHRAVIEASAAANAVQRLALLGIGQQLRAAVVEQQQVKLVGPVDFAVAPRTRRETTCRP